VSRTMQDQAMDAGIHDPRRKDIYRMVCTDGSRLLPLGVDQMLHQRRDNLER
jgi:hypothetical protein